MDKKEKPWFVRPARIAGQFFAVANKLGLSIAFLKDEQKAERLCALLNDVPVVPAYHHSENTQAENFRIAEKVKLFCLQEDLTYDDIGLDESGKRNLNRIWEEGLNGTHENSRLDN